MYCYYTLITHYYYFKDIAATNELVCLSKLFLRCLIQSSLDQMSHE